jgi:hypothetical protein
VTAADKDAFGESLAILAAGAVGEFPVDHVFFTIKAVYHLPPATHFCSQRRRILLPAQTGARDLGLH